jgi:hypothetical protein
LTLVADVQFDVIDLIFHKNSSSEHILPALSGELPLCSLVFPAQFGASFTRSATKTSASFQFHGQNDRRRNYMARAKKMSTEEFDRRIDAGEDSTEIVEHK